MAMKNREIQAQEEANAAQWEANATAERKRQDDNMHEWMRHAQDHNRNKHLKNMGRKR